MTNNIVKAGEMIDTYNIFGMVVSSKRGLDSKPSSTRFGVMYKWYAETLLSKEYNVPQNIDLPTAGGHSYRGHSLMFTGTKCF